MGVVKKFGAPGSQASLSAEDAARQMACLLEDQFDELGLSAEERDERYARAESRVSGLGGGLSIAASSE